MISQYIKGKTYIFIDAANVFYAQRTLGWRISYGKLIKYFKKECGEDTKCFIYLAYDETRQIERDYIPIKKSGASRNYSRVLSLLLV